jgi:hypothetical protein
MVEILAAKAVIILMYVASVMIFAFFVFIVF